MLLALALTLVLVSLAPTSIIKQTNSSEIAKVTTPQLSALTRWACRAASRIAQAPSRTTGPTIKLCRRTLAHERACGSFVTFDRAFGLNGKLVNRRFNYFLRLLPSPNRLLQSFNRFR